MGSDTTNYDLYKPAVDEVDWGTKVNENFDTIDSQMKTNADDIDTNVTAIALNTTHRTSTGADHSYINQSVVSGAAPTFTGTNFTGIPSAGILTSTVNPTNLLSNGDFEIWFAGDGALPTGWLVGGAGYAVAKESTIIKIGKYSAKLTNSASAHSYLFQRIDTTKGIAYWKGRTVTFGCWVWSANVNKARIAIATLGTPASEYSSYHTGNSTWQLLTVTITVPNDATQLSVRIYPSSDSSDELIAYFDGAMCVEGSSAFAFSPKPAEEGVWSDYSAVSTIVGWSSFTTKQIYTKNIGKTVFVNYRIEGNSDSTATTFTLPLTSSNTIINRAAGVSYDNGTNQAMSGLIDLAANSAIVYLYKDMSTAGTAWTASGNKKVYGQFFYESA